MSPGLYGVLLDLAYPVVDQYWPTCIAGLLDPGQEPNMFGIMIQLFAIGSILPASHACPNKTTQSDRFRQFWLEGLPPNQPNDSNAEVRRRAVIAIGGIYYDMVALALSNAPEGQRIGEALFAAARQDWLNLNATYLTREDQKLKSWIQAQPNR